MKPAELISLVWQIHSLFGHVTPGLLTWKDGRVAFLTQEGTQFDVPVHEMTDIKQPMLRMGVGFDVVVEGKKYKFSFTKPNPAAPELDDSLEDQLIRFTDAGRFWESMKTLRNVKSDKETTKIWLAILEG